MTKTYTHKDQPDNLVAWKIGESCRNAINKPHGDLIDVGLIALRYLQHNGLGVFELPTENESNKSGMNVVINDLIDKLKYDMNTDMIDPDTLDELIKLLENSQKRIDDLETQEKANLVTIKRLRKGNLHLIHKINLLQSMV